MKLKCDCGWEGEIWDAAITFYQESKVLIACPGCLRSVSIATKVEIDLEYVITDAGGTSRYAPAEAL